jgi:myosin protein heavy chain
MQVEDERRGGELHKEQADKSTTRVKNLKKQLDEAEEEISREKGAKRKLQREIEDLTEAYEVLEREVAGYRNKMR